MTFSNPTTVFRYHVDHAWSDIARPLGELYGVMRRERTAMAAQRGGDDSFGRNQSEVSEFFRIPRRDAVNLALSGARALSGKLAKIADDCLSIVPADVAAVEPLLKLNLDDGELRRLSRDGRASLGVLRAVASLDCAFGRQLRRALDDFTEAVSAVPEKTLAFSQRAAAGTNDPGRQQDPELLRELIDGRITAVDEAWTHLQNTIDGVEEETPLGASLSRWAANQ